MLWWNFRMQIDLNDLAGFSEEQKVDWVKRAIKRTLLKLGTTADEIPPEGISFYFDETTGEITLLQ